MVMELIKLLLNIVEKLFNLLDSKKVIKSCNVMSNLLMICKNGKLNHLMMAIRFFKILKHNMLWMYHLKICSVKDIILCTNGLIMGRIIKDLK